MNVVLVPHVGTALSHLIRALALATDLRSAGHHVSIACSEAASPFLRRQGWDAWHPLPWGWGHNEYPRGTLPAVVANEYARTTDALVAACAACRPQLIIGVPGHASFLVARHLSCAHLSLLHGPWLTPVLREAPSSPAERRLRKLFSEICAGPVSAHISSIGKRLGLGDFDYEHFVSTELILCADSASEVLDRDNVLRGGYILGRFGPRADDLGLEIVKGRSCVVTFGTALHTGFESILIAACSMFDRVIWISGNSAVPLELPQNALVVHEIDPISLAGRVEFAVSHGGIGTVAALNSIGCAQLCVPADIDQAFNSVALMRRGVGRIAGLEHWLGRPPLGRAFPPLSKEQLEIGLSELSRDAPAVRLAMMSRKVLLSAAEQATSGRQL